MLSAPIFFKSVFQKECFTLPEIMLEGLISWFLNNQLGKYLENVDTDQLSFSILQVPVLQPVLWIRNRIRRIRMFLGHPDPLVKGVDPDPAPDPFFSRSGAD